MEKEKTFLLKSVSYEIAFDGVEKAVVTPVLAIEASADMTLIGTLKVDNIELLPSFRASLAKGSNSLKLKSVKIIRPLPSPHLYRMELSFSADGVSYRTELTEMPMGKSLGPVKK